MISVHQKLFLSVPLRRFFPLLLVIFIDSFGYFIVIPILLQLYFNDSFGLLAPGTSQTARNILMGITMSISTFTAILAAPIIGSLSDQYGRKKTLLACSLAVVIGFLLPVIGIWQKNIYLVLAGRLVGGIGSASQPVAQAALVDLSVGKEKSLLLSWVAVAMTLPLILGPLAGGYLSDPTLVSWFNVTTPYLVAAALAMLGFLLVGFCFQETLTVQTMRSQLPTINQVIAGLPEVINRYQLGWLLLVFFCFELAWSLYYQSIALYLTLVYHGTIGYISLYIAYLGVMQLFGLVALYPLLLRFMSISAILYLSAVLVIIGFSACALWPTATIQWLFAPLLAIFISIGYVCLLTLISNRVPTTRQGWILGYASTVLYSAWLLTGFSSGWLISLHVTLPLYSAAIAVLIGGWGGWRLSRRSSI